MALVWRDFGQYGVASDVLDLLFLRTGNRYSVNLNDTNQHKSNKNEWHRFGTI